VPNLGCISNFLIFSQSQSDRSKSLSSDACVLQIFATGNDQLAKPVDNEKRLLAVPASNGNAA
jgi:hypothetical protein